MFNQFKIFSIAVLIALLLVSSANAFTWKAYLSTENGFQHPGDGTWIQVSNDAESQGSSVVVDTNSNIVGPTATHFSSDLRSVLKLNSILAEFKITDWVPSSKGGWGWAHAGFALNIAPMKLQDTLEFHVSYSKGSKLTLQLVQIGVSGSPQYDYIGKGVPEIIRIPLSAFHRPKWVGNDVWDVKLVNQIAMIRLEQATEFGQMLSSQGNTRIELFCVSSQNGCSIKDKSNQSWSLQFKEFNEWGKNKDALIVADDDTPFGGNSRVHKTSSYLDCYGPCGKIDQWNYKSAINSLGLNSDLYVVSSQAKFGYTSVGYAGWWVFPKVDSAKLNVNTAWVNKSKALQLKMDDTLEVVGLWPSGVNMTLRWAAQDIDLSLNGNLWPEYNFKGTGKEQKLKFPVGALRLNPGTSSFNPNLFAGLGFLRMHDNSYSTSFNFQLKCISINEPCEGIVPNVQVNRLTNIEKECEVWSILGVPLGTFKNKSDWDLHKSQYPKGLYLIRIGTEVLKDQI